MAPVLKDSQTTSRIANLKKTNKSHLFLPLQTLPSSEIQIIKLLYLKIDLCEMGFIDTLKLRLEFLDGFIQQREAVGLKVISGVLEDQQHVLPPCSQVLEGENLLSGIPLAPLLTATHHACYGGKQYTMPDPG